MDGGVASAAHRKRTGQFYTPPEVARFLVELLGVLAPELRTDPPRTVIDPACGQGVFLEAARAVLDGAIERVVGVDLHPQDGGVWDEEGAPAVLEKVVGDGLVDPRGERFDLVLGNPPFHGDGLRCLAELAADGGGGGSAGDHRAGEPAPSPERRRAERLARALGEDYTLWRSIIRADGFPADTGTRGPDQLAFPRIDQRPPDLLESPRVLEQLSRFPIELAFLERFVSLCRAGGHVIIVVPEGVVANRRLQVVRDWCQRHCRTLGVVSLPRGTFRKAGTLAVTAVLLLRRLEPGERDDGTATLVEVERLDRLDGLLDDLRAERGGAGA